MGQDWRDWNWKRIGTYLEAERARRGMTQEAVGAAIGVHAQSVANAEAGRAGTSRRKPSTPVALADFYGWTPDSLEAVGSGGEPTIVRPASTEAAPLTEEEREAAIAAIRASDVLSEGTKARVIESFRRRPGANGDSHATG